MVKIQYNLLRPNGKEALMTNIVSDYYNRAPIPQNSVSIADKASRALQFTGELLTLLGSHPALAAKLKQFAYVRYAVATLESTQIIWRFVDNKLTKEDDRYDNVSTFFLVGYKSSYALCGLLGWKEGSQIAAVAGSIKPICGFMTSAMAAARTGYEKDKKGNAHKALLMFVFTTDALATPFLCNWVTTPKWLMAASYGAMIASGVGHIGRCGWKIYDVKPKGE